jgi:hypothetical protein
LDCRFTIAVESRIQNRQSKIQNQMFDLSPFASVAWWSDGQGATLETHRVRFDSSSLPLSGNPPHLGLEWEEPRNIRRVVVEFDGEPPDDAHIEYWHKHWPQPDPESRPGSHRAWIGQDDPFHGEWVAARGECVRDGNTLSFTFDPLDAVELPHIQGLEQRPGYLARYRRALKIRLVVGRAVSPPISPLRALHAYSDAEEAPFAINVRLLGHTKPWQPTVSAYNGYVERVDSAPRTRNSELRVTGRGTTATADWREASAYSNDCTLLTFRSVTPEDAGPEFTINLADLKQGPLWIKDLGVYVTDADNDIPFEQYAAQCESAPRQPIYERVSAQPEQTYERAKAEIPALDIAAHPPYGRYIVLGLINGQQKFGLRYNGEVFVGKGLLKLNNRITTRLRWPGRELHWRIGTGDPADFRERNGINQQWLEQGNLPIVHTAWQDRDIAYEQTAFVVGLDEAASGTPAPFTAQRGDEDIALLLMLTARNTTTSPRRACIWLHLSPDEMLSVDEQGYVLAHGSLASAQYSPAMAKLTSYDTPVLRASMTPSPSKGESAGARGINLATQQPNGSFNNAVLYEATLQPGETVTLDIRIPFVSYSDKRDWQRLTSINLAQACEATVRFWWQHMRAAAQFHLPASERDIEDFTRAVPWHILMSASRDPMTGYLVAPPGTFWYGACGNEAAWQTTGLDMLGHHEHARAYLNSLMDVQGRVRPDGNFKSAEGALQAMDFDQGQVKASHFYYNLDHGTILEGILHHYRITGDKDWLRRIAPKVIAACDFVTRERAETLPPQPPLVEGEVSPFLAKEARSVGEVDIRMRGLMPPGHLEDNPEWRYWFAVNAHAYGGMRASADALAEIDHPEAARIKADVEAYRQDILSAAREARILSPVVRLMNGIAVPHVPARAGLRWRESGWIREVAYGAIHLWDGGLLDDHAPEVTWMLQDLEDNLFINREYGYGINVDDDWFSQGGITPQPNLMSIDLTYLRRDQVKHSLRNFYNNVVYGLYPDVRCLTEWMSEPGLGAGPFFKPSDEARVVTWLRHHLVTEEVNTLLHEDGAAPYQGEDRESKGHEVLWLAKGAPRGWHAKGQSYGVERAPTFFGYVTYRVESHLARKGEIRAHVELNLRSLPAAVRLRLRHPEGKSITQVFVNEQGTLVSGEDITLPLAEGTLDHQFDVVALYE